MSVKAWPIEQWLSWEVAQRHRPSPEPEPQRDDAQDAVLAELRHINDRLDELAQAFADGGSAAALRKATDKLEARKAEVERQLAAHLPTVVPQFDLVTAGAAFDRWQRGEPTPLEVQEHHDWLAASVDSVTVAKGHGFTPERLVVRWRRRGPSASRTSAR